MILGLRHEDGDDHRRFRSKRFHFYANCWAIVGRHLEVLRDTSRLSEVGLALRPHVAAFDKYTSVRNHYEHFHDRLPGRKGHDRLRIRNDLGNLSGTILTIGGEQTETGPRSLVLLRKIARDVLGTFKTAALGRLAISEPRAFANLARRAHGDRVFRKLQRRLLAKPR